MSYGMLVRTLMKWQYATGRDHFGAPWVVRP
jgi:hypothetical protein